MRAPLWKPARVYVGAGRECHRGGPLRADRSGTGRRRGPQPKPVVATSSGISGYLMPASFCTMRTTWQL